MEVITKKNPRKKFSNTNSSELDTNSSELDTNSSELDTNSSELDIDDSLLHEFIDKELINFDHNNDLNIIGFMSILFLIYGILIYFVPFNFIVEYFKGAAENGFNDKYEFY